jgi:flagellar motor switch protein FliM
MAAITTKVDSDSRTGQRRSGPAATSGEVYDFTRPDRIPQSQIRAIQLVFENAARSLSPSLSAQLGGYVGVNAVSFAQTSYREFIQGMPSPSVVATIGLKPFEGLGVIDLTPDLVFPLLEMLLGRRSEFGPAEEREVTDIELRLLEGIIRIILQDLREAWKAIAGMEFKLQSISKEPQFVQALAPSEAVLAVRIPVTIGDTEAAMHVAIPAPAVSRMRQDSGQQWKTAATAASPAEQQEMMTLLEMADTEVTVEISPASIRVSDLLALKPGDLLITEHPIHRAFQAAVNGRPTMSGDVVRVGRNLALEIAEFVERGAGERADGAADEAGRK